MKTKINILIRLKNSITALLMLVMMFASANAFSQCTGTINLSATNADAGATLEFAYTDANGIILEITGGASFTNVPEGTYKVYALQYSTGSAPTDWAVGQDIDNLAPDACNQLVGPQNAVIICGCAKDVIVTANNTDAGASQSYAITDAGGIILYISNTTTFSSVPEGSYNLYGLQYTTGSLPASWAVGQNISSTTNDACNQLEGPNAITVSCITCTDAIIVLLNVGAPGCPSNMLVDLTIKNGTGVEIPVGTPVSFYDGDPTMGGATLIGTYNTTTLIATGAIERFNDVNIGGCSLTNGDIVYAVLGDDGSNSLPLDLSGTFNNPAYDECDNTNNKSAIKLKVRCGKYNSMIKK